jgi:diguanylate cyclase (GGDEF)-like protein
LALSSSTRQEWVVLLEVADEDGEGIDRATFARLADFWTDARANALYSPSRYALQVSVQAPNPAGALSAALLRWQDALRHSGLPEWKLVRAELVTPQELERQIVAGELEGDVGAPAPRHTDRPSVAAEDDLLRRALHDDLTGLLNRELLLDGVRATLAAAPRRASIYGIIAVHVAGARSDGRPLDKVANDEVLVAVADRMAATVRWTEPVARVGEHELAALIEGGSADHIAVVAARILDRVSGPVHGVGGPVSITASLGTEMAPGGADADIVLLHAERAMRAAISLRFNPATGCADDVNWAS